MNYFLQSASGYPVHISLSRFHRLYLDILLHHTCHQTIQGYIGKHLVRHMCHDLHMTQHMWPYNSLDHQIHILESKDIYFLQKIYLYRVGRENLYTFKIAAILGVSPLQRCVIPELLTYLCSDYIAIMVAILKKCRFSRPTRCLNGTLLCY